MPPSIPPRQLAVLRCTALGMSEKETAIALNLSTATVGMYMRRLRVRLGSFNRMMIPGIALLFGIVSVAEICGPALALLQKLPTQNKNAN